MSGDPTVPALEVVVIDELRRRRHRLAILRNVVRELGLLELTPADHVLEEVDRLRFQAVQVAGSCITCDGPMYTSVKVDDTAMPRARASGICAPCDSAFTGRVSGGVTVIESGEASGV